MTSADGGGLPTQDQPSPGPTGVPESPDGSAGSVGAETSAPVGAKAEESTVGTGSYVAVSCTVMMLAATVLILAVLFVIRWLS
ncbi:MAG: hypothetical protein ACR2OO_09660 [Thermomicrobiales bacterium]